MDGEREGERERHGEREKTPKKKTKIRIVKL